MKEMNEKDVLAVTGGTYGIMTVSPEATNGALYIATGAVLGAIAVLSTRFDLFANGFMEKAIFGGVVGGAMGGLIHMAVR